MNHVALSLVVDSRVYDLVVVQSTAHRFSTTYSFNFELNGCQLTITAVPKPGLTVNQSEFNAAFLNELLDQQLRKVVAVETKTERDLILAYAFSNTKLIAST